MSRTKRNAPGWTTAKVSEICDPQAVRTDYERGHPGRGELKDNPKRRESKWKLVMGVCCTRQAKRFLKAKRNRAERRSY